MQSLVRRCFEAIGLLGIARWIHWWCCSVLLAVLCRIRYVRQLWRIRHKAHAEKIRVLFIVSEISKWKEQPLYDAMEASGVFEPIVGLSAWNAQLEDNCSNEKLQRVHAEAEAFYEKFGDRHVRTVRVVNGERIVSDLSEFDPDIVFYTEPWLPCGRQSSRYISRFALTCLLPYYIPVWGEIRSNCQLPIHYSLNKYFVLNSYWAKYYGRHCHWVNHICEYVPLGHPALDCFTEERLEGQKENLVIYAPHFSFYHPKHLYLFQFISTFLQTGESILAYAQQHPELKWAFKPHPLLRWDLEKTGAWPKAKIDAYYAAWEALGATCYDGDYQDLFLMSRAMITDSGSFLMEYGATGAPLIQLVCSHDPGIGPEPTRRVVDTYYRVHNLDEMYATFAQVLERGEDPERGVRLAAVRESGLLGNGASEKIVAYLRELLHR